MPAYSSHTLALVHVALWPLLRMPGCRSACSLCNFAVPILMKVLRVMGCHSTCRCSRQWQQSRLSTPGNISGRHTISKSTIASAQWCCCCWQLNAELTHHKTCLISNSPVAAAAAAALLLQLQPARQRVTAPTLCCCQWWCGSLCVGARDLAPSAAAAGPARVLLLLGPGAS